MSGLGLPERLHKGATTMTMIRNDLSRLFVSLAGALMLSTLCIGAAIAPAHVATIATA